MTLEKQSPSVENESYKEKHQQQILFSEDDLATDDKNLNNQQLVFDNHDYIPAVLDSNESDDNVEGLLLSSHKKPRWLWRIIFMLFTVLVTLEAFDFFTSGFVESPITTSIYAAIVACLSVIAGASVIRELTGLKQFKRQQKIKVQAGNLLAKNTTDTSSTMKTKPADSSANNNENQSVIVDVEDFCNKISAKLPCDLVSEQEQAWADALSGEHSQAELLQLYSRVVLTKVDEKALAEVAKFSTEATVLVALSPVAIIDMLIMLWRNLRMINKIAGLYGLKLGYWSRIKLIKQVFINMVYAGASELVADFGTEMIGADLLGKVSGRLAQGLGAGMLTARLGVRTMQLCRPIPFTEQSPRLGHVRKEVLNKIKALIKS
jgi:putative membrane protein